MPSLFHEALLELFRNRAELTRELLRILCPDQLPALDQSTAESASIDLSQVTSTEYRADQVTVFRRADRSAILAVVVEVQLHLDPRKRSSWPVYLTAAGANLECPVLLLVLAPDPAVARWASRSIPTGHPGFDLRPLVLSYAEIPRVVEAGVAIQVPELGVLSALAHPEHDVALAAFAGLRALPDDQVKLYFDLIWKALSDTVRTSLEAHMLHYQYESDFALKYIALGREEGQRVGREEGQRVGREEGQRRAALALARAKLGALSPQEEAVIAGLHDERRLEALIVALGQAVDAAQAREALLRC
ncbi:MAG: hypothetical protein IPI49_29700 [Myxococcales bacterium]|nr:hypothetical protein [Myxococcales bacterium]HRC55532.1 hypothetical protein [Kofleriaceae bacterium]